MPMKLRVWCIPALLVLLFSLLSSEQSLAGRITVAVASNFAGTLEELVENYKSNGDEIVIVSGATGKLTAQIVEGAPFDIFLSADDEAPRVLVREGRAVGETEFTYAIGKLALWSADPGLVSANGEEVLRGGNFRKLAYANPKVAPYGVAAETTLRALGLFDILQGKIVTGENIGQAFSMIASGGAELGFVALSQVLGSEEGEEGSFWEVPMNLYPAVRQNAILLARAKDNPAASAFLEFLKSGAALEIIRTAGYEAAGS